MVIDFNVHNLADNDSLYRYLSFEQFLSLCERSEHIFTQPAAWDDSCENAGAKMYDLIYKTFGSYSDDSASFYNLFVSCWTTQEESDAMWRIYSPHKNGVKIKIKLINFRQLSGTKELFARKVRYVKFNDLPKVYTDERKNNPLSFPEITLKRDLFSHEHEVRLMCSYSAVDKDRIIGNSSNTEDQIPCDRIGLTMDMKEYIEEVVLDPRISAWEEDALTTYCKRNLPKSKVIKSNIYNDFFG